MTLPASFALVEDPAAHWPTIGLLPPQADDALAECLAGRALMFAGPWGTFVVGLYPGQTAEQMEAFVLLAVAAQHGAFEAAEPAALAVARDLKATTVAFRSVRRGWARRLGPAWTPRGHREFVRSVHEWQEARR